jgi:ribosome-binding factor A
MNYYKNNYLYLMESIRQKKVSKLIQKELGEWFRRNSSAMFGGAMLSITVVRVSADLSVAKIYISVFPGTKTGEVFKILNENNRFIRKELGGLIGKSVRIIPELHFYEDDSLDYAQRIEELLKK